MDMININKNIIDIIKNNAKNFRDKKDNEYRNNLIPKNQIWVYEKIKDNQHKKITFKIIKDGKILKMRINTDNKNKYLYNQNRKPCIIKGSLV